MIDSIEVSQSLAGLLEIGFPEAFDWDSSAVADWPNIAPTHASSVTPAAPSSAASLAAHLSPAC